LILKGGLLTLLLRCSTLLAAVASLAAQSGDTPWPSTNWTVSTPEAQGMDSTRLEDASKFIQEKCPTRYSLLVVRHGRIVFERYYGGTRAADANNICSMSKSILSVLVGIAFDEGRLRSTDQKLAEFFPDYIPSDSDPRKRVIRLQDVLSMTAGFQWDDLTATGAPGGDLSRCLGTSNWLRCMLAAPMKQNPGTGFNYDSGLSHAVSGILSKATGMTASSYAASRLFAPLGIYCPRWSQDPQGISAGGFDVWLTVRDLARFGLLMLNNGEWNGRRIVSSGWLDTSMRLRVRAGSAGWGFGDYAYFWWKKTLAGYPVTLASGYGGQNIFLIPELDLLVMSTARSDLVPPFEAYQQSYDIVSNYVLPAIKAPSPVIQGTIVQAADGSPRLAAGTFATATGSGLALVERDWSYAMPGDGLLPECIAGACVTVGKRTAHVRYVRPDRIDFLLPPDLVPGHYTVEIRTPQGAASAAIDVADVAPAWNVTLRDAGPFVTAEPAAAGSTVTLRASGLGASIPPAVAGTAIQIPRPLANQPEVFVSGQPAAVLNATLAEAGVWSVDVRLPADVAPGAVPIQICSGAVCSRPDTFIEIH
jgi:uncharacterized protein (TIGR03437 family)